MAKKKAISRTEIMEALIRANGFKSEAAKLLGTSQVNLYRRLKTDPEIIDQLNCLIEKREDFIITEIIKKIKNREVNPKYFELILRNCKDVIDRNNRLLDKLEIVKNEINDKADNGITIEFSVADGGESID